MNRRQTRRKNRKQGKQGKRLQKGAAITDTSTTLRISYNGKLVNGLQLSRAHTISAPDIMFETQSGKMYTLVMYDNDSPQPAFVHWIIPNITNPKQLPPAFLPYVSPDPPAKDKHYHTYMFVLYEQPGPILLEPCDRIKFNPSAFATYYGLTKIAQNGFYINPQS